MTARQLFYASSGILRTPWRIAAFLVVFISLDLALGRLAAALIPGREIWAQAVRGYGAALLALVASHAIVLRAVDKRAWSTVGLGRPQAAPALLGAGLAFGALGILVPSGLLLLAHWLRPAPPTAGAGSSALFALQLVLFFLPQSLTEELLSRGYLFAAIREGAGNGCALALTALPFAAMHLWNPGADAQSFTLVLLAGIFLGAIIVVTGSLWAAWMAHFAWNFAILGVLHAPVSGVMLPAPGYTVVDAGPAWATGGSWGPEGGAAAALGMCAGLAVLFAWHRRGTRSLLIELAHG